MGSSLRQSVLSFAMIGIVQLINCSSRAVQTDTLIAPEQYWIWWTRPDPKFSIAMPSSHQTECIGRIAVQPSLKMLSEFGLATCCFAQVA